MIVRLEARPINHERSPQCAEVSEYTPYFPQKYTFRTEELGGGSQVRNTIYSGGCQLNKHNIWDLGQGRAVRKNDGFTAKW